MRHVIGVHAREEVVARAGRREVVEEGVDVAVLGAGGVEAVLAVPSRDAPAGEVARAELGAEPAHLGIITLVEDPGVDAAGARVALREHAGDGRAQQGDVLTAGDEGGGEGDPVPGLGHHRDGVPPPPRRAPEDVEVAKAEERDQQGERAGGELHGVVPGAPAALARP